MSAIKFWPNKKTHKIDVVVETDNARVWLSLDLDDAADSVVDFSDAVNIVTEDWIEE